MHNVVNEIMNFAVYLINILGYPGILIAGSLEFLGIPVSGEVLIPLIGLMISKSKLNIVLALIFLTIGSVLGTLIMYAVGYFFSNWAKNFIRKRLASHEGKLDSISHWMRKNGSIVVFITRFLPFVRVYVSLIAGIERIPIIPFTIFSTIGITLWNLLFLLIGYYLGAKFNIVFELIKTHIGLTIAIIALIIIICIILFFLFIRLKKRKNN
ncbi:MAG: DedA family protein [Sarcina sp.]